MNRSFQFLMTTWLVMAVLPVGSAWAQKSQSLPHVPITYRGDTNETILRRAQWIEEARKEKEVVWWGSQNQNQIKEIADEFKKIYPFLKVNYWRGGTGERITKLESEHASGHMTADICDAGEITDYPRWRKKGLVDKYTDFIPGIRNIDKRMYSRHGDWAMLGNNAMTPQYNTKLVTAAEAPKSWEDMLNPRWKGQIGLVADMRPWYTLAVGEGGWGIEKTEEFLRRLKQQDVVWVSGQSAGHRLLIAGELKVFAWDNLRHIYESQKIGAPADWVRVRPIPVTGGAYLLTKKAPHPHAARLFIEWQFSQPGMAIYEKVTGYGFAAPGAGTRIAKTLEGSSLIYRTEELLLKVAELGLIERFARILDVEPR